MEPIENIEEIIRKKLNATPDPALHDRILARVRQAQAQYEETTPAPCEPVLRRTIMKSPITKLAVAAAIIAAVVLGLFEFISTDASSGVVWAEVARKIEASRGVIYRERHGTDSQHARTIESDYGITYLSPTEYRSEGFKGGQCWITMYDNRSTAKRVVLLHAQKGYVLEDITLTDEGDRKHANYQDPTYWVRQFMACEYTKLDRREIDGALCEGIETTDPALCSEGGPRIDNLIARLWVSIETGYPVLLEGEFYGESSTNVVFDQFQWDAELDPSVFEPNIPADYEQM